ncbi:MAG TPA: porin, partial [Phycisphaerae bacterium]
MSLMRSVCRWGMSALLTVGFVAIAALPVAPAAAQTPAPAPATGAPTFFQNIQFGGLADGYYDYNANKTEGDAPFRNFDTKHNDTQFSMAQAWVAKAPTADSRVGFNAKVITGHAAEMIHAAEPSTLTAFDHIEQLYASYLAPVGGGLQIDAGKFVTQHGAEVIEAKDNWNYSRSLLFALAIPYYHTGVRATYTMNDKFSFMGDVVNGWNNLKDNNGAKTFGAQAIVKPVPQLSIIQNYMVGAEQADNDNDVRHLFDTTVIVTATPMVSVMANYDYGKDSVAGSGVSWQGVAGYVKVQALPWLAVIPRVEVFDDPDGFMTGTGQTMKDATVTGEVKLMNGFLYRLEYRRDL